MKSVEARMPNRVLCVIPTDRPETVERWTNSSCSDTITNQGQSTCHTMVKETRWKKGTTLINDLCVIGTRIVSRWISALFAFTSEIFRWRSNLIFSARDSSFALLYQYDDEQVSTNFIYSKFSISKVGNLVTWDDVRREHILFLDWIFLLGRYGSTRLKSIIVFVLTVTWSKLESYHLVGKGLKFGFVFITPSFAIEMSPWSAKWKAGSSLCALPFPENIGNSFGAMVAMDNSLIKKRDLDIFWLTHASVAHHVGIRIPAWVATDVGVEIKSQELVFLQVGSRSRLIARSRIATCQGDAQRMKREVEEALCWFFELVVFAPTCGTKKWTVGGTRIKILLLLVMTIRTCY